jgi:hypothetical protein
MYNRIDRNMKNVNNSPHYFSIFFGCVFAFTPQQTQPWGGGGGLYSRVYINAPFFQKLFFDEIKMISVSTKVRTYLIFTAVYSYKFLKL